MLLRVCLIGQHLTGGLPGAQAFIILVPFRNIAPLIEFASLLAANDHRDRPLPNGDLGMNFVGSHKIDLTRPDQLIDGFPDPRVSRLRAIIEAFVLFDPFASIEDAIECVDVRVIVNARASALPGRALGQTIDRETVIRIFVKKQILGAAIGRNAVRPRLRCLDNFRIG